MNEREKIEDIIGFYLDGKPNDELDKMIREWLTDGMHTDEKDSALHNEWDRRVGSFNPDPYAYESYEKVRVRLGLPPGRYSKKLPRSAAFRAAAVVVPVFMFITLVSFKFSDKPKAFNSDMPELYTGDAAAPRVQLPDGSVTSGPAEMRLPDMDAGETCPGRYVELKFKNTPLEEVFEVLGKCYGRPVEIEQGLNLDTGISITMNGKYNLEEALGVIGLMLGGLGYSIGCETVRITK